MKKDQVLCRVENIHGELVCMYSSEWKKYRAEHAEYYDRKDKERGEEMAQLMADRKSIKEHAVETYELAVEYAKNDEERAYFEKALAEAKVELAKWKNE